MVLAGNEEVVVLTEDYCEMLHRVELVDKSVLGKKHVVVVVGKCVDKHETKTAALEKKLLPVFNEPAIAPGSLKQVLFNEDGRPPIEGCLRALSSDLGREPVT